MRAVLITISAFLIVAAVSRVSRAGDDRLVQAARATAKGQAEAAYRLLDGIEPSSDDFPDALVEIQKLHYVNQDWPRFFAFAQFYRANLAAHPEAVSKKYRSRAFSLEALALAKHCQWDIARVIDQEGLRLAAASPNIHQDQAELNEILEHLEAAHRFPAVLKTQAAQLNSTPVFNSTLFWGIPPKELARIPHPRVLRVKVKNQCAS